ncbi:hypothetical protein HID58_034369, partial [Brassica napus]
RKGSSSLEPSTQLFVSCLQKACLVYLFHVLNTGNDNMVVRVILIQKTLIEHAEKLRQVKAVLEEGGNFSEIYRKVQLKPLKWDGEGEEERHVEALMILKYGGVLTHAGRK